MWKEIPNFENYLINENGEVLNTVTDKLIVGDVNNGGYYRVTLYSKNGHKRFFMHRLVAMMFIPNPLDLKEVNHIDGNKANNSASNLEWCSRRDNELHARRTHIKGYKPFKVIFDDGHEEIFEARKIKCISNQQTIKK